MNKLLLLLLFFLMNLDVFPTSSGLFFSDKMPKTELRLYRQQHNTPQHLSVSFDMYISQPYTLGQVTIIQIGDFMLSLTYVGKNPDDCYFVLNPLSNKQKYVTIPFDDSFAGVGKWFSATVSLSLKEKNAEILINDQKQQLQDLDFPQLSNYNIYFGPHKAGLSSTVPMAIANIVIKENNLVKYVFPLNESEGNLATDTVSNEQAEVQSPVWLIDSHHYWQHIGSYKANKTAGVTYDSKRKEVIIIDRDSLKMIRAVDKSYRNVALNRSLKAFSSEAIYDSAQDMLLYYNLHSGDNGETTPFFARINMDGRVLKFGTFTSLNPLFYHASLWNQEKNELYIFGGYGNYIYFGNFLRYDEANMRWDTLSIDAQKRITPRMHTVGGSGNVANNFYIFGGVGNESGSQELGKDFYSDLYLFDAKTLKLKEIRSSYNTESFLIPKKNLIFDKESQSVFILCTNRSNGKIALYRFNVDNDQYERVSNETLINTNCMYSTAYLFYDEELKQFCMIVKQAEDHLTQADFELFTLSYPPVTYLQLNKSEVSDNNILNNKLHYIAIIALLSLLIITLFLFLWRKNKKKRVENLPSIAIENDSFAENHQNIKNNAIFVFGEFTIIDKNGVDISSKFGSKIKQLFILILLHSIRYGEGVSTEHLSLTIWSNKTVADAKNIRGVTISNLRALLKELEGISLDFSNEKWIITITEQCYCDYKEVIDIEKQPKFSAETMRRLLSVLKRGHFLPAFYQYAWFENGKVEFDENIVRVLEKGISLLLEENDWNNLIIVSNILFSFDNFNDIALKYKILSLSKLGQLDNARKTYENFCKEYYSSYNVQYPRKMSDLIK